MIAPSRDPKLPPLLQNEHVPDRQTQREFYDSLFPETIALGAHRGRRWRGAATYCIPSIASESVYSTAELHTVALLSADGNSVTVHDPSSEFGYAERIIPKQEFSARWAASHNHALVVIDYPARQTDGPAS